MKPIFLSSTHPPRSLFRRSNRITVMILLSFVLATGSSGMAFAGENPPPPPVPSPLSLSGGNTPNPSNGTISGQMMTAQQAAMGQQANTQTIKNDSFQGNIPRSTSISPSFSYLDTFGSNSFNGGYGGGLEVTHWVSSSFGLTGAIGLESFEAGRLSGSTANSGLPAQSGSPLLLVTIGAIYDFTGGKDWINPQAFLDVGPTLSLNGESMPFYADMGLGVSTPLAKISKTLDGMSLFADLRGAYLNNMGGGVADIAGAVVGRANHAGMFYMPVEFGMTFVFSEPH